MAKDDAKKEKKRKAAEGEETAEEKAARKAAKKAKKAAKAAEAEAPVEDKKEKKKKKKKAAAEEEESPKKKKSKKEKKKEVEAEEEAPAAVADASDSEEEEKMVKKTGPKPGDAVANPTGTTEVFMGNLSYNIDDDAIKEAFKECGTITNIKWLEDRDTGKFKGCGFISFEDADQAAKAVGMAGSEVLGREIKCDFAGGKKPSANANREVRPMQAKPDGCTTIFAGNLNFNIDDDAMKDFFKSCGEVSSIRWLTDRDTGDFKGCGFIEFADPAASLDKAAALNGTELMGRQVRLDFAAPRAPKTW